MWKRFLKFCDECDQKGILEEKHIKSSFSDYPKLASVVWFFWTRFYPPSYTVGEVCYRGVGDLFASEKDPLQALKRSERFIIL